jgi:cytochrome c556
MRKNKNSLGSSRAVSDIRRRAGRSFIGGECAARRYISSLSLSVILLFAALTPTFVAPRSAMAHKGAHGVVLQRMEAMKEMKTAVRLLDDMLKGRKMLRHERVRRALGRIEKHSGGRMTSLFPKGSAGHPSEADPAIWSNWDEFSASAARLGEASHEFSSKAKANKKTLLRQYRKLRAVCKSCHDRFRQ